jgi:diguanylate cyclase (GGDEF)-like protein
VRIRGVSAGQWWPRILVAVLSVTMVVAAGIALQASQASAHRGIEDRFAAKSMLSADFTATFVSQLTARERLVAKHTLTGRHPAAAFAADEKSFGFKSALLLDDNGRALAVAPRAPSLIGTQIGANYTHLTAALHGHVAVSNAVPSAARGAPVVAFAVPFQTPYARRVFSGAYPVAATPLAAYLNDATSLVGAQLFLDDGNGTVLATSGPTVEGEKTLAQVDPALAHAAATSLRGSYRAQAVDYSFSRAAVAGTTWTLVVAAPDSAIFAATDGSARWLPWLILCGLSLLIGLAWWLSIRLLGERRRLLTIARTDALTGLSTRLYLSEQLETLLANARRYDFPVAVLMIDIDHFKQLNDTYGHQAGDHALQLVADRLAASLRCGDLIARWGGEEFLAVLPHTGVVEALEVAERLCVLVAADHVELGPNRAAVTIRASVGVAEAGVDGLDALVHRADLGLYEAKQAGRNTARAHSPRAAEPVS